MNEYVYYNGKVGKWDEISIPLSDRSIFFADAVYDAALGAHGKGVYLGKRHTERLFSSAGAIGIKPPLAKKDMLSLLSDIGDACGFDKYFLYFQLSAMADERRHAPRDDKTSLLVIAKMHEPKLRTLKLISYPDRRHSLCHVKTTNLLGAVLASNEAHNAEADEAVLLRGEYVTECAHSNISIIKDSVLITHPLDEHILPGIMRERLIIAAKGLDISVSERPFSYSELLSADDVIVSSTTRLAERATELDGIEISRGNHQTGDALMAILRKEWELFCSN